MPKHLLAPDITTPLVHLVGVQKGFIGKKKPNLIFQSAGLYEFMPKRLSDNQRSTRNQPPYRSKKQ